MSATDELVKLERAEGSQAEEAAALRAQLDAIAAKLDEAERESIRRRKRMIELRRKAEAERIEAERAHLSEESRDLIEFYTDIAQSFVWYNGIMPHQMQGAMFGAVAERWILADEPGLGKTRTVIGWLDLIGASKVILIGEANICEQLYGEVLENAPHRQSMLLYKRTPAKRHELIDSLMSMSECVVVMNYEMWRKDKDALGKLIAWQPDTLIVDEGHNIKTTSTSNYKLVQFLVEADNTCPRCGGVIYGLLESAGGRRKKPKPCPTCKWTKDEPLGISFSNPLEDYLKSKSVKNLVFTTGTPILNAPDDLYSMLHLIDPTLFRLRTAFLSGYCKLNVHSGKYEFLPHGVQNLRPLIDHRFLARTREDAGVILPPRRVHVIPVELDKNLYPKQYRTIRQISEAAQIILDSGESTTIMHLISLLTRKRQANVWPGGIQIKNAEGEVIFSADEIKESVKIDTIIDHIAYLHDLGKRQVVFSQFKTALAELERRLLEAGYRVARLDGDTPKAVRTKIKDNFYAARNEDSEYDVLLANYKTGGTGLNLTAATEVHILDEEWNAGKRDQAYDRVYRIGQEHETNIYVYRIPHTIDTAIANIIRRKERMVDAFRTGMVIENDEDTTRDELTKLLKSGEIL